MFTSPNEKDSVLFHRNPLKPCPFCGGEPHAESCDRLIQIGCAKCNFYRSWHGLVQGQIVTNVVAIYSSKTGEPTHWYDKDAYVRAAEDWNTRIKDNEDRNECD